MKQIYKIVLLVVLLGLDLYAVVSAKDGSLNRTNTLYYGSGSSELELNVKSGNIVINNYDDTLVIPPKMNLKRYNGKKAPLKLMKSFIKQPIQETEEIIEIGNEEGLTKEDITEEIKRRVSQERDIIRIKLKGDIKIPEELDENIVVEYIAVRKLPYPKMDLVTYVDILDMFLSGDIRVSDGDRLMLKNREDYFLIQIKEDNTHILSKLDNESKSISVYDVEIVKAYTKGEGFFYDKVGDSIFKIAIDTENNLPYQVSFLSQSGDLTTFDLNRIFNNKVKKYLDFKKNHKLALDGFDFSKELIEANYKVNTKDGVSYLVTKFAMTGKRKNIISIYLKGSSSILEPSTNTNTTLEHFGFAIDAKKFIFEVKKKLKVDGQSQVTWVQKPKKSMVSVIFKDSEGQMSKKKWSRGQKQYYDISILWYLISWNNLHNIEQKPFLLMNKDFPIESMYIKKPYGYDVKIKNKLRYKFYLDKFSRISKVEDVANNLVFELTSDGFMTKTIKNNRKQLKNIFESNNLVEVK